MASIEERLDRVERELDRLRPSLDQRVARLEQASHPGAAPDPRRKRFVAWMGAELPKFLTAGVLLLVGWWLKDSVDLAIKQRQLDLSYAKELQGLLQTMGDPAADMVKLEATAVVIASYGDAALPPLLSELRRTGLRADAAAAGIATLALTRPDSVCDALPQVLGHRGQQYDWQAHLKVVRLLGANGCRQGVDALQSYATVVRDASLGNAAGFEALVSAPPPAPAENYPQLLEEIEASLRRIER
jgi:hypothetical protein